MRKRDDFFLADIIEFNGNNDFRYHVHKEKIEKADIIHKLFKSFLKGWYIEILHFYGNIIRDDIFL